MSNLVPCVDENGVQIKYEHKGSLIQLFYDKEHKTPVDVFLGAPITAPPDDQTGPPLSPKAPMPVNKNSPEYNMNHPRRGKAVMFLHHSFDKELGMPDRPGSNADRRKFVQTFSRLGFEVEVHENRTAAEIVKKINELSKEDHNDADCMCIAVSTHSFSDNYIYAKDFIYPTDYLSEPFSRCPSLAGKPKLFFISACRGERMDSGIILEQNSSERNGSNTSTSYKIPKYADFLFAFSTVKDHICWRDTEEGSWFFKSLCEHLDMMPAEDHLVDLLTDVARSVGVGIESHHPDHPLYNRKKQVPNFSSTLMRKVFLRQKKVI